MGKFSAMVYFLDDDLLSIMLSMKFEALSADKEIDASDGAVSSYDFLAMETWCIERGIKKISALESITPHQNPFEK